MSKNLRLQKIFVCAKFTRVKYLRKRKFYACLCVRVWCTRVCVCVCVCVCVYTCVCHACEKLTCVKNSRVLKMDAWKNFVSEKISKVKKFTCGKNLHVKKFSRVKIKRNQKINVPEKFTYPKNSRVQKIRVQKIHAWKIYMSKKCTCPKNFRVCRIYAYKRLTHVNFSHA